MRYREFSLRDRLDHVVVSAEFEAGDDLLQLAGIGHDDHGHVAPCLDLVQRLEAPAPSVGGVEDDDVVAGVVDGVERTIAADHQHGVVTHRAELLDRVVAGTGVEVDQQQPHRRRRRHRVAER